jgi:hypothetical protein
MEDKNEKKLFHFVHVTVEDEKRENEKIISELTEDKKSEFSFQGNYFYETGRGHAYGSGFFTGYITKTGITAWRYDSGKWSIGSESYNYEDGEFVIIPKHPVNNEPIDWGSITFPKVKKLSGPVAHKLPSVKPI